MDSNNLFQFWLSDKSNESLAIDLLASLDNKSSLTEIDNIVDQLSKQYADSAIIQAKIVELFIRLNQFKRALDVAEQLMKLTNNHPKAVHYLILNYFLLCESQKVIDLSQIHSLIPESFIFVIRSMYLLGDIEPAVNKLESLNPTDAESFGVLAIMLLDLGELNKAQQYCSQSLALSNVQFEALLTKASIECAHHDFNHAEQTIEQLIKLQPLNGRVLSLKGQCEFYNVQFIQAIETFTLATKHMPEHIGTWHLLAWALFLTQQLTQAQAIFEHSITLDRNFGESHGGLACAYASLKKNTLAEESIARAVGLDKNSFSGRYAQAILLANAGQENQANELVDKITQGNAALTNTSYSSLIAQAATNAKLDSRGN